MNPILNLIIAFFFPKGLSIVIDIFCFQSKPHEASLRIMKLFFINHSFNIRHSFLSLTTLSLGKYFILLFVLMWIVVINGNLSVTNIGFEKQCCPGKFVKCKPKNNMKLSSFKALLTSTNYLFQFQDIQCQVLVKQLQIFKIKLVYKCL